MMPALREAISTTEIANTHRHVVLCPGDHFFTQFVRELRALGISVTAPVGVGVTSVQLMREVVH